MFIRVLLLVVFAAGAAPAGALEVLELQPVDFGATVTQIVASQDGSRLFLIARDVDPSSTYRLLVWDVPTWKLVKEIALPAPPYGMAWCEGKLVVSCPTARPNTLRAVPGGTIAIIDPVTLAIQSQIAGKTGKRIATPLAVLRYAPKGKAVLSVRRTAEGEDVGEDAITVELDLKSGALTPLTRRHTVHAAFLEDRILQQHFPGSPAGAIEHYSLAECRKAKGTARPVVADIWNADYSPLRMVHGGAAFVSTHAWYETTLFDAKTLAKTWSVCGQIIDVIEPASLVVMAEYVYPDAPEVKDSCHLIGIDAKSSRTAWRARLKLPQPLRYGVYRWRPPPTALVTGTDGDHLLMAFGDVEAMEVARDFRWYRARLPAKRADGPALTVFDKTPPTQLVVGEKLELKVVKDRSETGALVLQSGPPGVAFDAETGKLAWTAADMGRAKQDIVIGLTDGDVVIPVLRFPLHVAAPRR